MSRDHLEEPLGEIVMLRLFPVDKERIAEIVKDHPDKYESVSHAIRCAVQHFIKKWGEIND